MAVCFGRASKLCVGEGEATAAEDHVIFFSSRLINNRVMWSGSSELQCKGIRMKLMASSSLAQLSKDSLPGVFGTGKALLTSLPQIKHLLPLYFSNKKRKMHTGVLRLKCKIDLSLFAPLSL